MALGDAFNPFRALEHFSDDSTGVSSLPTAFANSRVKAICAGALGLDQNRQTFVSTLEDMSSKLSAAESSVSLDDKLTRYKTQLTRINALHQALLRITGYFNGDDIVGTNCIQNLVDFSKLLNVEKDQVYLEETTQLLSTAEDTSKTVFSMSNKIDSIRNYLINFLNIGNRNLSYARLLCLKGQLLHPTLLSQAQATDAKLQAFVANLETWCSQMAKIDPQPTSSCTQPALVSTPLPAAANDAPIGQPVPTTAKNSTAASNLLPSTTLPATSVVPSCPITSMAYDSSAKEYKITSHPSIEDWGIKNTLWQADGGFVPDYVAQKLGLANRCKSLDDFEIANHKDIKQFVPLKTYNQIKTAAEALQDRVNTCEAAFARRCRIDGRATVLAKTKAKTNRAITEPFASSGTTPSCDTLSGAQDDAILDGSGQPEATDYDIKRHKDYPALMKNYTANCRLPKVCNAFPIENNIAFPNYVSRSACEKKASERTPPTPLAAHPDFPAYNQSCVAKADLQAKTATQNAERACQNQLVKYSGRDSCGRIAACKELKDYPIQQHPDFAEYTKEWRKVLDKYACKDSNGRLVTCQTQLRKAQQRQVAQQAECAKKVTMIKRRMGDSSSKPSSGVHEQTDLAKAAKIESDLKQQVETLQEQVSRLSSDTHRTKAVQVSPDTNPDMRRYVLRTDVKPCPTKEDIRANIGSYLTSIQMRGLCEQAGFQPQISSSDTSDCQRHFHKAPQVALFEPFQSYPKSDVTSDTNNNDSKRSQDTGPVGGVKPYPQPHNTFNGVYDIMLHRDYQYSNPRAGHIPKQECYDTYARFENGLPVPCRESSTARIEDHPEFEKTVLHYGAVKDRCGKIQKPPPCPSLIQNECGDWVHGSAKCNDEQHYQAQLQKEKAKYVMLLAKYQRLAKQQDNETHASSPSIKIDDMDVVKAQLNSLKQTLTQMQSSTSILPPVRTPPPTQPLRPSSEGCSSRVSSGARQNQTKWAPAPGQASK